MFRYINLAFGTYKLSAVKRDFQTDTKLFSNIRKVYSLIFDMLNLDFRALFVQFTHIHMYILKMNENSFRNIEQKPNESNWRLWK